MRVVVLAAGLLFVACATGSEPGGTPETDEPASPATESTGSFTLSTSSCRYEGPRTVAEGAVSLGLTSTAGQADFDLWRMDEGHSFQELSAHVTEEVRRAEEGLPELGHPAFATLVAEATTDAEGRGTMTTTVGTGVYGMACIRHQDGTFVVAGPFAAGSVPIDPLGDALGRIVLAESDPPTGTEFLEEGTLTGHESATHAVSDPDVQAMVSRGFVDGLIRGFLTPSLEEALFAGEIDECARNFDRSGHLVLASWAFAYLDEASAQRALEAHLGYHTDSSGLRQAERLDLGDGGARLEGHATYADGMPTHMYWWRSGSLVLGINSNGSVEADAAEIRAIAEGMQARAE